MASVKLRGADASRFVPAVVGHKRVARAMGGMRSGASFIDWRGVYASIQKPKPTRIDYIMCQMCAGRIDLHRGSGVTHIAGIALCAKCAEKD